MADLKPGDGNGKNFERYWTRGEGLARWAPKAHPWTTLYRLLLSKVGNASFAKRLTETYFVKVFGYHSGSRKGNNPVGPG